LAISFWPLAVGLLLAFSHWPLAKRARIEKDIWKRMFIFVRNWIKDEKKGFRLQKRIHLKD